MGKNFKERSIGINDADYFVAQIIDGKYVSCKIFKTWTGMLERCYSEQVKAKRPTYIGCTVCDEWLTFSNFKRWMETQDYEGKQLDKDLISKGNKVYSPETCIFISPMVNSFISSGSADNGFPVGVQQNKQTGRFYSDCLQLGEGKRKRLGTFATVVEAAKAYVDFKKEMAVKLASMQTDARVAELILERFENLGEELVDNET